MNLPIVKNSQIVMGPFRLSYVHLFEKQSPEGSDSKGKYSASILIPKSDKTSISAIKKAVEAAKRTAIISKWGGKEPKKLDLPLRDGDEKDDEVYADHFYINAKNSIPVYKAMLKSGKRVRVTEENSEELYSGMWALVSVEFYGYNVSGNRGIACSLNGVVKTADDECFGGNSSDGSEFDNVDLEGLNNEDDEDL